MPLSSRAFFHALDKLNEIISHVRDDPCILLKVINSQGESNLLKFATSPLSVSPSKFTGSGERPDRFCN